MKQLKHLKNFPYRWFWKECMANHNGSFPYYVVSDIKNGVDIQASTIFLIF